MKRLLYLATILITSCLSSCSPENSDGCSHITVFYTILIVFAIACICKAAFSATRDDQDEGHAESEDNAGSEEHTESEDNAQKEESQEINEVVLPVSKLIIKEETISIKSITESQHRALFIANPETKRTLTLSGIVIKVVGARYRAPKAKAIYRSLNIGDPVYLKLEPDNPYDNTAVKVMAKYNCIGYVPSEYSNAIYSNKVLGHFDKCYVVEPSIGRSLYGLQIVIFVKPGVGPGVEGVIG